MRTERALLSVAILASTAAAAQAAPSAGITGILNGTPWWVYAVFIFLVASGIQALRPRSWPFARIAAAPLAFTAWGIASLLLAPSISASLVLTWLAAAGSASGLALITWRSDRVSIDRATRRISLPPSWAPLARYLAIFAAKYAISVAMILNPAARESLAFWDIAVSGLSAGYFLGWLAYLAAVYFAPPSDGSRRDPRDEDAPVATRQGHESSLYRQIDSAATMQDRIAQMFRNDVSLFGRSLP